MCKPYVKLCVLVMTPKCLKKKKNKKNKKNENKKKKEFMCISLFWTA